MGNDDYCYCYYYRNVHFQLNNKPISFQGTITGSRSPFAKSIQNLYVNDADFGTGAATKKSEDNDQTEHITQRVVHHRTAFHQLRQIHTICKALRESERKRHPSDGHLSKEVLACLKFMRDHHKSVQSKHSHNS